jgi:allantoicase
MNSCDLINGIELSSVALGGRIVAVSDEFFVEAFHLLLVEVCSNLVLSDCVQRFDVFSLLLA